MRRIFVHRIRPQLQAKSATAPDRPGLANKPRNMVASLHVARPNSLESRRRTQSRAELAVEHGIGDPHGPGPLLVIAGAGSGKTAMLAHRVAALILAGADPKRIMLATFSRRAAAELGRRVERLLARRLSPEAAAAAAPAYSGTFHAIGAKLLREYAPRLGLDPQFTIHDREDSADLMNWARHEAGLAETKERFPTKGTCLAIYSRVVNARGELRATLGKWFPWVAAHEDALRSLFAAYVEAKQRQNVLDYDDLLLYFAQMLAEPDIAAEVAARFDHLLVDEYQDTNALQAEIVLALRPRGMGLTVVGDDAQSIYSFRAATVRNILDFPSAFDPPAKVVTLERNYRSTQPILSAANAVIALAPERYAKDLWTDRAQGAPPALVSVAEEADQARYVAIRVLANREAGAALKSQAVLSRLPSQRRARTGADAAQHALRQVRRPEVPRRRACEGRARADALRRKSARPGRRLSRRPAPARRRAEDRRDDRRRGGGRRRFRRDVGLVAAGPGPRGFAAFAELMRRLARAPPPGRARSPTPSPGSPRCSRPATTTRAARIGDLEALERIPASFARASGS